MLRLSVPFRFLLSTARLRPHPYEIAMLSTCFLPSRRPFATVAQWRFALRRVRLVGACVLCLALGCRSGAGRSASESSAPRSSSPPAQTGALTQGSVGAGPKSPAALRAKPLGKELHRALMPSRHAGELRAVRASEPPSNPSVEPRRGQVGALPKALQADTVGTGDRYRVAGVADHDTLSLRAEAGVQAPRVGRIPARAQGVVATGAERRVGASVWRSVEYSGQRGWVNARYLRREAAPERRLPGAALPAALQCYGTEPFWRISLTQNGGASCTQTCGGPGGLSAGAARSQGDGRWLVPVADRSGAAYLSLTVEHTGTCNDGMSDRVFAYSAQAARADGVRYEGCCQKAAP